MKNKKKASNIKQKSPSKLKHSSNLGTKQQMVFSMDSYNLSSNKSSGIYYGKRFKQQFPRKKPQSNQSSTHCSINNKSGKQKSFENKKNNKNKSLKNQFYCHNQIEQEEQVDVKLTKNQIMQLINSYAVKIQRQWRRHWFRKCLSFIILKKREQRKYCILNDNYHDQYFVFKTRDQKQPLALSEKIYQLQQKSQQQNKQQKKHSLPKLISVRRRHDQEIKKEESIKQQNIESQNAITDGYYNNKKYASISSINSKKLISNQQLISSNPKKQIHQRTSSLGEQMQIAENKQLKSLTKLNSQDKKIDFGLNCSISSSISSSQSNQKKYFNTPINQLNSLNQDNNTQKKSTKNSNIKLQAKVYQCKIIEEKQENQQGKSINQPFFYNYSKNSKIKQDKDTSKRHLFNQFQKEQKFYKRKSLQEVNAKSYDTKFPLIANQKIGKDSFNMKSMFKTCKKAIEKQKSKSISSIAKKFEEKQITERTYKKLIKQTNEKVSNDINQLQLKQRAFANNWNEVYVMFKEYVKQNSIIIQNSEKQHQLLTDRSQKIPSIQNYHEVGNGQQHSISIEKWDFQASAKKSISHLESFQEFAKQLNERNPQKLKGFFFQSKNNTRSDHKTIELVLDQLDKLESQSEKIQDKSKLKSVSQFKDQEISDIIFEFKRKQRAISFQKNSDHVLVENISEKISQTELKSPMKSSRSALASKLNQRPVSNIYEIATSKFEQINLQREQAFMKTKKFDQFVDIRAPIDSQNQYDENRLQSHSSKSLEIGHQQINLPTEQSQEQQSQVEMKITSIKTNKNKNSQIRPHHVGQKLVQNPIDTVNKANEKQNILIQVQKNEEIISNQNILNINSISEIVSVVDEEPINRNAKARVQSINYFYRLSNQYLDREIKKNAQNPSSKPNLKQISSYLFQFHRERQYIRQLQEIEKKKYPPTLDPTIDAINNWLLEISHHLLDHHNNEIRNNLINVKQMTKEEMLSISKDENKAYNFFADHSYLTITEKIFKQFEFFYLKNIANNLEIQQYHRTTFEHLLYAFHRCLIDCMNITLLQQLSIGQDWVVLPWVNSFRYTKKQLDEHSKQCLQKAINRVSSWGQYAMAQLTQNNEVNQFDWRQYQQEKMNLIVREEVLQYSIQNDFYLTNFILKIQKEIYQQEIGSALNQLQLIFQR